jgi:hypothetical protein
MRKWFYAGAVAGGFLLLGAAPAQADVVPAPVGGLLGSLGDGSGSPGLGGAQGLGLDPAGGLNLASPLGGSPLTDIKPGQNSADVSGPASDVLSQDDVRTREADEPAGRAATRGSAPADLPLLGGLTGGGSSGGLGGGLTGGSAGGGRAGDRAGQSGSGQAIGGLGNLIPANLLGGGLWGGGLTADGRMAPAEGPRESALFDGGVPLLGGLGGLLPANETPRTLPATGDDTPTGMPAGGTAVDPALDPALVDPADGQAGNAKDGKDGSKNGKGQAGKPAADQAVEDPRLHEEPTDNETGGKKRSFSDGGRPVAGEDEDFR